MRNTYSQIYKNNRGNRDCKRKVNYIHKFVDVYCRDVYCRRDDIERRKKLRTNFCT
jgi:hypothetical protein